MFIIVTKYRYETAYNGRKTISEDVFNINAKYIIQRE